MNLTSNDANNSKVQCVECIAEKGKNMTKYEVKDTTKDRGAAHLIQSATLCGLPFTLMNI